jgi:predicted enzyme related to lactoylglutathione lyase
MGNVDRHTPGSFCWIELGTSDQDAAKHFYSSLLGWGATDNPMGTGDFYTTFDLRGRKIGGGYNISKLMPGVPSHWMLYVCVEDADAIVAKAKAAGGKIPCETIDVMEYGRMAVLQDPTGAHISIWQPKSHPGFQVEREAASMCWADLMSPDQEKAKNFYHQVFGWELDPGQDNSGYLHIKNGNDYIGGIPPARHRPPNAPPHWLLYIQVESCDASTGKASDLGAKVMFAPMTMENVGRWSIIADPQGAVFSLFEPMRR